MSDFAYKQMVSNINLLSYIERLQLVEKITESLKIFREDEDVIFNANKKKQEKIDSAWENVKECQKTAEENGLSEMSIEEINSEIMAYRNGK